MEPIKEILLCTESNPYLSRILSSYNFTCFQCEPQINTGLINETVSMEWQGLAVVSLKNSSDSKKIEFLTKELPHCRKLLLSPDTSPGLRSTMLDHGITDLLIGADPFNIIEYIQAIYSVKQKLQDTIMIIDKDSRRKGILNSLFRRFGYNVKTDTEISDLINNNFKSKPQIILLNLNIDDSDLIKLIRSVSSSSDLRNCPFIVYQDKKIGVSIHQLLSGLKRITKAIMTPDELFTLLIYLFERITLVPKAADICSAINLNENLSFSSDSLGNIYRRQEKEILSCHDPLDKSTYLALMQASRDMCHRMQLLNGIRWMTGIEPHKQT